MKIRIQGNSVRLRLSQQEVDDIGRFNSVEEITQFPRNSFTYRLKTHASGSMIESSFEENKITFSVNKDVAKNWATTDLVGFQSEQNEIPFILIEKDFKCLTDRPLEDESDLFPNPNISC